ncbi:hypothetical protein D043_3523B, partial [Vibrio parahaemolyticus EKP-021]
QVDLRMGFAVQKAACSPLQPASIPLH